MIAMPAVPGVHTPARHVIRRRARETADTFTWELAPLDGPGARFAPGQFNMLYAFGAGEVPVSISGDPARPGTLIHTIRAVGRVTSVMERLEEGEQVGARGPFGRGWPVAEAQEGDLLIVAGGVGLAPLRPVVYHTLAHRNRYRNVALLYGARTPADLLFAAELDGWRAIIAVAVTVDSGGPQWRGDVGAAPRLIGKADFDPARATAFVCGPEVMMRFCAAELVNRGVAAERIHVSLERNMACGMGLCGRCQLGPVFVCKDGPVFPYPVARELLAAREL
ncbi:MAG: FAD/NAD(P)-binding protein [Nitrospinae bacterium]|nr:FAD/NAD(P)-binding protein [Nitrospinota bacterium]